MSFKIGSFHHRHPFVSTNFNFIALCRGKKGTEITKNKLVCFRLSFLMVNNSNKKKRKRSLLSLALAQNNSIQFIPFDGAVVVALTFTMVQTTHYFDWNFTLSSLCEQGNKLKKTERWSGVEIDDGLLWFLSSQWFILSRIN